MCICIYFYIIISCRIGNGGWISDGVVTRGNTTNEAGQNTVNCASSHLTSFAVLFTAFDSVRL